MKTEYFKHILVVNLGGIGDLLLSTPALKALKDDLKPSSLSILVVPRVYDLAKSLGYIDQVYILQKDFSFVCIWKNFLLLLGLRQKHFDLAINMRTMVTQKSALMMKYLLSVINPAKKAGRNTNGRGGFFDIQIQETDLGQQYEMEYDIEMVKALGVKIVDRNLKFELSVSDFKQIESYLAARGISPGDIIVGIHPGGKSSQTWPIENFIKTIEGINKLIKCKFVITGQGRDRDLVDKIKIRPGINIVSAVDRLNLKQLGALIKICRLYISNDTGPMHIASILNTPLVAIFGPGDLKRFDPRNISKKAVVLQGQVLCSPCNRIRCKDLSCLKKITPEAVIKESLGLLV